MSPLQILRQRFQQSTLQHQTYISHPPASHGGNEFHPVRWSGTNVFLQNYPEMSILPDAGGNLIIQGEFRFCSTFANKDVSDSYNLRIEVPSDFPQDLPDVYEVSGRIPEGFHRMDDSSLCLGSPLGLRLQCGARPSLTTFVHKCVVPYLHAWTIKESGCELPFGELDHGFQGIIDDYKNIFRVDSEAAAIELFFLASRPRSKANRVPCPCKSGLRVGRCHHKILNRLRKDVGRLWFKREYAWLNESFEREQRNRKLMASYLN